MISARLKLWVGGIIYDLHEPDIVSGDNLDWPGKMREFWRRNLCGRIRLNSCDSAKVTRGQAGLAEFARRERDRLALEVLMIVVSKPGRQTLF